MSVVWECDLIQDSAVSNTDQPAKERRKHFVINSLLTTMMFCWTILAIQFLGGRTRLEQSQSRERNLQESTSFSVVSMQGR